MEHKTDWKLKDTVTPGDMNRIEGNIKELETPSFNDSGTVSDINSFTDFVNSVKSKMSIFDFFRNFKAGLKYIVHQGQIINSQDVTQAGFAMDARQANPNIPGSLGAKISDLNNNIGGILNSKTLAVNIDDIFIGGCYDVNLSTQGTLPISGYALLFVRTANTTWIYQDLIYTDTINFKHYHRMNINNTGWTEWEKYTSNSDIISCEIDFGEILLSNGVTVKSYDFPAKYPNYKFINAPQPMVYYTNNLDYAQITFAGYFGTSGELRIYCDRTIKARIAIKCLVIAK